MVAAAVAEAEDTCPSPESLTRPDTSASQEAAEVVAEVVAAAEVAARRNYKPRSLAGSSP